MLYQFILTLLTYLPIGTELAIKMVSVVFDYLLALSIGKLTYDLSGKKFSYFVYSYAITVLLPTVFLNSAAWGQCDSIFATFCVLCVDMLLPEDDHQSSPPPRRTFLAFVMLGLAFAMKLQAIFILPFIMYLYFIRKDFSLLLFLIPLAINMLLPVCFGRGLLDTFSVYLSQTSLYRTLSVNSSSIWLFLPQTNLLMVKPAILITLSIFGISLVWILDKAGHFSDQRCLLFLLLWSCWTCVMFLPCMHERYNYLTVVLSIVVSIIDSRALPFAIVMELCDFATYGKYLTGIKYFLFPEAVPLAMFSCVAAYICFSLMLYRAARRRLGRESSRLH